MADDWITPPADDWMTPGAPALPVAPGPPSVPGISVSSPTPVAAPAAAPQPAPPSPSPTSFSVGAASGPGSASPPRDPVSSLHRQGAKIWNESRIAAMAKHAPSFGGTQAPAAAYGQTDEEAFLDQPFYRRYVQHVGEGMSALPGAISKFAGIPFGEHVTTTHPVYQPDMTPEEARAPGLIRIGPEIAGRAGQPMGLDYQVDYAGRRFLAEPERHGLGSSVVRRTIEGLGGLQQAAFSPLSAFFQTTAGDPVTSWTGSPIAGDVAAFAAGTLAGVRGGRARTADLAAAETPRGLSAMAKADAAESANAKWRAESRAAAPSAASSEQPVPVSLHDVVAGRAAAQGAGSVLRTPESRIGKAVTREERIADIAAAKRLGVDLPGAALTDAGTGRLFMGVAEMPGVGTPAMRALSRASSELEAAGQRIAGELGDINTMAGIGARTKGGMMRFAEARDVRGRTPDDLTMSELKQAIDSPTRETSVPFQRESAFRYAHKLLPEEFATGGSDDSVTRIMGSPKNFRGIVKELVERNQRGFKDANEAQRQAIRDYTPEKNLPSGVRDPAWTPEEMAADPARLEAVKRGWLRDVPAYDDRAMPLKGSNKPGLFTKTVMDNPNWTASYPTMRDFATELRYARDKLRPGEFNVNEADLKRMQSAIYQDQMDIFQRNIAAFNKMPKKTFEYTFDGRKQRVTGAEMAQRYQAALDAYKKADYITRTTAEHIETLQRLYGKESDEMLARSMMTDLREKTGNFNRIRTVLRDTLSPGEADDVRSGILRQMWKPNPSARGYQEGTQFSASSFITNWNKLSDAGKALLTAGKPGLKSALDDFVRVTDRMANLESLKNFSGSGTTGVGLMKVLGTLEAVGGLLTGHGTEALMLMGAEAAGAWGIAKFLSSPLYVNWLSRAVELSGKNSTMLAARTHINALARIASRQKDVSLRLLGAGVAAALDHNVTVPSGAAATAGQPARRERPGTATAAPRSPTSRDTGSKTADRLLPAIE